MAVNPHAETYQGKTQFSGPVKAGSRWNAVPDYDRLTVPGTIAATDLPNAGYVVCSQSAAVDQASAVNRTATDIMLPPGSMIISIQYIVTAAFTGTVGDLGLGVDPGGSTAAFSYLTDRPGSSTEVVVEAVGVYNVGPNAPGGGAQVARWRNISDPTYVVGAVPGVSVDIRSVSSYTGTGRAIVTINYIPEFNYPLA